MKKKPIIAAIVLAAATLLLHAEMTPRVIEISAKRFAFTPNQITLKKGEPVTIRMTAADHSHGLLVKPLGIDLDAGPGQPDQVTITPTETGQFSAICDDYCGSGHGSMKMTIIVE
ncbi:MAG TPA: cupredoxin domain-containing protein [Thermoanaerobaculia bacterium]|nr:cupredoxin domain-containing protein [Thermoanaerobaculia bacterium]